MSEHGAYSDLIAGRYANRKQLPPSAISSQLDNASIKQKPETAIRSLVDCNHKSTPCQLSKEREWRNQNDTTKQGAPKGEEDVREARDGEETEMNREK